MGKASVVPGGLRTGCLVDMDRDGTGQQQIQNCSDDFWIEEQKKCKRKLARPIRGSLGQLNTLLSEDMDKIRCHCAVSCKHKVQTLEVFAIIILLLCLTSEFLPGQSVSLWCLLKVFVGYVAGASLS